jgi:hypothetical protein
MRCVPWGADPGGEHEFDVIPGIGSARIDARLDPVETDLPIDLIVVDNIVPTTDPDTGKVTGATHGRRRVWADWTPAQSHLKATKYAYALPPGAVS